MTEIERRHCNLCHRLAAAGETERGHQAHMDQPECCCCIEHLRRYAGVAV